MAGASQGAKGGRVSRALTDDQVERLFHARWNATKDPREVAITLYEAGRDGAGSALEKAAHRDKQRRLRRRLPDHLKERAVRVLVAVAARYGMTVDAILEKRRCGEGGPIAEVMWCLRLTGMSFPEVAIAANRENHTTVISGCARVERRFAEHISLRPELEEIAHAAVVTDLPRRPMAEERPGFAPSGQRQALRSVG